MKELEQILTGNFLLTFSLLMACTMVRTGGMGVLEHPAGRQSGSCPLYKRFFKHLEFGGIGFRRGSTAHHPRNQRFCWSLTCRILPDLPMAFREWLLRAHMPKGASIGLTSDGFWQTGIGFDSLRVAQVAEPPAEDIARWRSMNQTEHSRHLGQDFAA